MASIALHIGVPKTGSSFLQGWLRANRDLLAARGVFVPERNIYSHRLAVECLHGEPWQARADITHIKGTALEEALGSFSRALGRGRFHTLIISSEYFCYALPGNVVSLLQARFAADIRLIVYIRSQSEVVPSGYNQSVKMLGATGTMPKPVYEPIYDWSLLLDAWRNQLGLDRLKAISFDTSSRDGRILADFLEAACPTLSGDDAAGAFRDITFYNESLPADLLEFKRLANLWGEFGLGRWLEQAVSEGYDGPRFGMSREEARAWREIYAASNAQVARTYFSGARTEDIFPEPADDQAGVDLTGAVPIETVARLLALHMRTSRREIAALSQRVAQLEEKLARLQPASAKAAEETAPR